MRYRAVFFDRDGTLTYFNPSKKTWRDETISGWSGTPFELDYEKMMALFRLAAEDRRPWYRNVEEERAFFLRYYRHLLAGEGVTEKLEERAALLHDALWCNNDRLLYPEAMEVLDYFKARGYQMGVISDTSPSLELTLRQLGLGEYFTSYTASSLVGVGKPDPRIYNAALKAQGVKAQDCLYVDDTLEEADGARALGFTSFYLDRSGQAQGEWVISDLTQMIDFIEGRVHV